KHWLSAHVEHPVVGVLRWREQAAFPPFEGALGAVFLPELGGPPALQDQGELLVQMMLDVQRLARRNLANEHAQLGLMRAIELEECTQAFAGAGPWFPGYR